MKKKLTALTFVLCLLIAFSAFSVSAAGANVETIDSSASDEENLKTDTSDVNPSDYSFDVKYIDVDGNVVSGGGTEYFSETGKYSRENIPLPVGYLDVVPAHPSEDWLYPTALELIDGVWTVTNPVVEIVVEPMAAVNVVFKDVNGNILTELCYVKYFDGEGGGIETIIVPDGYELAEGDGTFAVEILRDENGRLVSSIDSVEFTLTKKSTAEIPEVNPSDYSFEVKYIDIDGNVIPGGGTEYFSETGKYSRENIPLPVGYLDVVPAHPSEDWLYPTALEYIDGVWTVTNPVVEIMVEPMAAVNIVFKDTNGNILTELCYVKYFDGEGGGIETIIVPDGYELAEGDGTFAVEIFRDENGRLVSSVDSVEFTLVKITEGLVPPATDSPSSSDTATKPTEHNDDGIVKTGEQNALYIFFVGMLLFGGVTVIGIYYRKNKINDK